MPTCKESPIWPEYIPVRDVILDILKDQQGLDEAAVFHQRQKYLSVVFFDPEGTNVSFWITLGKRRSKLETKFFYYLTVDELLPARDSIVANSNRRVPSYFTMPEDIYQYQDIIRAVYQYRELEATGRLFACCHRYTECSDAMYCTNPNKDISRCCTYRRNLTRGIVFYGKNRNIDGDHATRV